MRLKLLTFHFVELRNVPKYSIPIRRQFIDPKQALQSILKDGMVQIVKKPVMSKHNTTQGSCFWAKR